MQVQPKGSLKASGGQRKKPPLKLAQCLDELDQHDAGRILRITGIRQGSVEAVREYFQHAYDQVDDLLLASPLSSNNIMGFLLLRSSAVVSRALADGEQHNVSNGTIIKIHEFRRRRR